MELLKTRIADDALREMGYTSKAMYSWLLIRVFVLFLVEMYLVMGLSLFSTKDDIINLFLNTVLPILVAIAMLSVWQSRGRHGLQL